MADVAESSGSKTGNKNRNRNGGNRNKKTPKPQHSGDHKLRKRQPAKPVVAENVIYISTQSNIKALMTKCDDLIFGGHSEVVLYALGAAIQRGILLALQVTEKHTEYEAHTNTLTTKLIDDLEPATDEADYEIQKRCNSAVRIILRRTQPLPVA